MRAEDDGANGAGYKHSETQHQCVDSPDHDRVYSATRPQAEREVLHLLI